MTGQESCATSLADLLAWQFQLTWRLAEIHLAKLTDEVCLWEPAADCWTVRRLPDGDWRADWAEAEPDPIPAVSIGWITWHLIWWWLSLLDVANGKSATPHDQAAWPGSAEKTVLSLQNLSKRWGEFLARLSESDLDRPLSYPWPEARPLKFAVAWANSESMKNVAEIGVLLHLSRARRR